MTADWYNMSAVKGTSILTLIQTTDNVFFLHFFGTMILIVLFVIMLRGFIAFNNNPRVSLMYSGFFTAILSVLFRLVSLINDNTMFICWGMLAILTVVFFLTD